MNCDNDFEEFLLTNLNNNSNYLKIYKLHTTINMNKFLKILNISPFYKYKGEQQFQTTSTPSETSTTTIVQNQKHNTSQCLENEGPSNQSLEKKYPTSPSFEKECPICREKVQGNVYLRKLKCNHEFHKKCIDKWLFTQFKQCKDEYTCPLCRQSI
jgi:hypothetical protein